MSNSQLLIEFAIRIDTGNVWHCQCPIYETKTTSFVITPDQLIDINNRNKSSKTKEKINNNRVQTTIQDDINLSKEIDFNCGCR